MQVKVEFQELTNLKKLLWLLVILGMIMGFVLGYGVARAEGINVGKLATAIYYAENSKIHPYGILAHYKTTTPRQACINTINHALRDWNGQGDFILFLSKRYAPIGANNDPKGLNRFWVKNVRYYYGH